MSQVFITGDKHGRFDDVFYAIDRGFLGAGDALIVLGDAGVNYYGDKRDAYLKKKLNQTGIYFLFVRGNHEARPSGPSYWKITSHCPSLFHGDFLAELEYPNLLYMRDGGTYQFFGPSGQPLTALVIGGAYSVDKHYRLQKQAEGYKDYKWFADEQLSESEKETIAALSDGKSYDYVFTHTVPFSMIPRDMFLANIDQTTVDDSMEHFLQQIKEHITFTRWFAGHWHTDRSVDSFRFMYRDIIPLLSGY